MPRFTKIVCCFGLVVLVASLASAQGVMFVKNNRVGIGTSNPAFPLHVNQAGARGVFQDPGTGPKNLLELRALVGIPFLRFNSGFNDWDFSGTNIFLINEIGDPEIEMKVFANGNMEIMGTLTQGSSRELKTDIEAVDPADVLARLMELPIAEWSYRDDAGVRHLGPMAEDFAETFGLGNNPSRLATIDTSGVALAAVQALHAELAEKDSRIESLEAQLDDIKALVEGLTNR